MLPPPLLYFGLNNMYTEVSECNLIIAILFLLTVKFSWSVLAFYSLIYRTLLLHHSTLYYLLLSLPYYLFSPAFTFSNTFILTPHHPPLPLLCTALYLELYQLAIIFTILDFILNHLFYSILFSPFTILLLSSPSSPLTILLTLFLPLTFSFLTIIFLSQNYTDCQLSLPF